MRCETGKLLRHPFLIELTGCGSVIRINRQKIGRLAMKQKNTSDYVDLGNLLFDSSFLDVRMEVALRDVTEGGDFEALPDPFVQIDFSDGQKYYLASLQFGKGFYHQDVLLNVLPRSVATDSTLSMKTSSLTNISDAMAHILDFGVLKNKKTFNATFICKREKILFHPPCPMCGKALKNHYGETPTAKLDDHLLYCPACKSSHTDAKFNYYRNVGTTEGGGSTVGGRLDLIAGFGELMGRSDVKISGFPCVTCAGKSQCYPEPNAVVGLGDAVKLIVPFSFESFQLVAYEYLPLRFHEYASLIGGQDWQGLFGEMAQRRDYDRLQFLQAKYSDLVVYPLAEQPEQTVSLPTILHVKLSVFQKLCKALLFYHQNVQAPYGEGLALGGMLDIVDDMNSVPQMVSSCRVKLKPPTFDKSNAASISSQTSNRRSGQLSVTSVDAVGEDEPHGVKVSVELSSVALLNHTATDGEIFIVHLGLSEGFTPEIDIAFEVQSQQGDQLILQSVETLTDINVATQFRTLRHLPYVDVSFVVTQAPGIERDLEQLGHILLSALLCNASQSEQYVRKACIDMLHQFEHMVASLEDGVELSHALQELITKNDTSNKTFQSINVFYFPEKVSSNDFYLSSDVSWVSSVLLGLRLMSRHQKLTYLDHSVADEQRWQTIVKVVAGVEQLMLLLSGKLFDSKTENQELMNVEVDNDIYSILSKVIKDPEWLSGVLDKSNETLSSIRASESVATSLAPTGSQPGYETEQRTINAFSTDDTVVGKPSQLLEENLDETLIISKDMVRDSHEKTTQEHTMVMQPIPEAHEIPKDVEIDLEETIVLSPRKRND